jgi:hypothetical protein
MKRAGIIAIFVALATGLATTGWAAETGSGAASNTSGASTMDSGDGMNNGGMKSSGSGMKSNRSDGENKGLPGGHSGDDLNKPGNGDHGNNGANGG